MSPRHICDITLIILKTPGSVYSLRTVSANAMAAFHPLQILLSEMGMQIHKLLNS